MAVTFDKNKKTWTTQFYYTDYNGVRRKKKKCGFSCKRDAESWEKEFLSKHSNDFNMPFENFLELYLQDAKTRVRESSFKLKKYLLKTKALPYFKTKPVSSITPLDVRNWQNKMLELKNDNGKPYSQTYLRNISTQLSSLFNHAVKYYGLPENPCHKVDSLGKASAGEMKIWTPQDFQKFLDAFGDKKPAQRIAFTTLFYTGLRVGELLALTPNDIDLEKKVISVTKTFRRSNGEDIITPPKTKKSNRKVTIPNHLANTLGEYIEENRETLAGDGRLFPFVSSTLAYTLKLYSEKAGIERIRLHDLRHSHASLLISMGCEVNLIADRLGHEKTSTTLDIYGHLYPDKRNDLAQKLDSLYERESEQ